MRLSKVVVSFVHDAIVACMTVSLALYLRLGDEAFALPPADVALMTVSFLAISATAFTFFGVYRGVWRYASLGDLMVIIQATTVAVLLFIACMYLFKQLDSIPRSVPVIQWFLLVVVLGGSRFSYRLFRHQHRALAPRDQPAAPIPVLLVGACEGAEQFIRSTKSDVNAPYKVVGVVDDHAEFQGRLIHGVPVLGQCDELTAVLARPASRGVRPQRLIMADATGKRNDAATQEMLRTAERLGLTAACLPRLTDFRDTPKDGEIDLQPIALEDLLGRPQASTLTPEAATAALEDAGFVVEPSSRTDPVVPQGQVADTDPPGGSQAPRGSTVTLFVSEGPQILDVPTVIGMPEAEAREELAEFSVAETATQQFSPDVEPGSVVAALDADGAALGATYPERGAITLVVSVGPVPPVEGLPGGEAQAKLEAVNLVVSYKDAVFDNEVPKDNVVTAEWTKDPMRPGDTVILTLSKGADLVTVPNVVGKNMAEAIELIEAAGLVASWELPDLFLPVATVQSQDPAGDTQAVRNSTVRIVGSLTL